MDYEIGVEESYRYYGYISEEEVEWYFLMQSGLEPESEMLED